jgi:DNA processing protein
MKDLCLTHGAAGFPRRLTCIPDPPSRLWVRGDPRHLPQMDEPAIAIVGCRAATRDGLESARRLADGLTRAGVIVVSGLARGIDAAAHEAALTAHGRTIAVLGSGLGFVYPPEHRDLAERMLPKGAVVSEYAPETPPHPGLFPRRNRLVSGLADAVLVVEAPEKSGALITAGTALDQGKDVMVVPGRVSGGRNRGGHQLIRDGATLVETTDDILLEMGWLGGLPDAEGRLGTVPELMEFTVDDVVRATGEPSPVVLARLLQQELAGEIRRVGSARFLRVQARVLT